MVLPEHATLISNELGRAVLSIDTAEAPISQVINRLTETLSVHDITIHQRPIEEVIAEVYEDYSI